MGEVAARTVRVGTSGEVLLAHDGDALGELHLDRLAALGVGCLRRLRLDAWEAGFVGAELDELGTSRAGSLTREPRETTLVDRELVEAQLRALPDLDVRGRVLVGLEVDDDDAALVVT